MSGSTAPPKAHAKQRLKTTTDHDAGACTGVPTALAPPQTATPLEVTGPIEEIQGGSSERPRWVVPTLLVIAALAGATYAWGVAHQSLEIYYEAAVLSMASNSR